MNLNQFDWKQTKCTQNWPLYGDTSAQIHCAPYPPTSRATLKHKRRQRGFSRHHSEAVSEMCSMLHLSNIFHWATQSRGYQSDVNDANSAWKVRVIGWLKERHWKDEPQALHFFYSCTVEPVGPTSAGHLCMVNTLPILYGKYVVKCVYVYALYHVFTDKIWNYLKRPLS